VGKFNYLLLISSFVFCTLLLYSYLLYGILNWYIYIANLRTHICRVCIVVCASVCVCVCVCASLHLVVEIRISILVFDRIAEQLIDKVHFWSLFCQQCVQRSVCVCERERVCVSEIAHNHFYC